MRLVTRCTLCAALLFGWSEAGQAQTTGGDFLSSVLFMGSLQHEYAGGTFFAFNPTSRGNLRFAPSSGDPGSDSSIVVGGKPNGGTLTLNGGGGDGQTFFAFDPAYGDNR